MDTADRDAESVKGTPPPEPGPVRVYGWEWGREEDRRPQVPWIGIFLLVFGALLLVTRLAPQFSGQQPARPRGGPRVPDRLARPARHVRAVRRRVPDRVGRAGPVRGPRLRPR